MFKIHFKKQLLLLIALITFSSMVYSDLPMIAKCALYPPSVNINGQPSVCPLASFPGSSYPLFHSVIVIYNMLYPVVIALTLAFIAIRLFKKLAKKAV